MPSTRMLVRRKRVVWKIDPGCFYTLEGVLRFAGLGEKSISEGRRSGKLNPIEIGRRLFYDGNELIEWIKSHRS